jgi:hypothetical protein
MSFIFTHKYQTITTQLKSEVSVLHNENDTEEKGKWIALWDTGATNTVITQNIIDVLTLKPVSFCKTHTPAGIFESECYYVNILLTNKVLIKNLLVLRGLSVGWDILIGMDIISRGDFAISNFEKKTTFTFRIPSLETIDFINKNS